MYNEQAMSQHLTMQHFSCHICGDNHKYRFYRNYPSLEKHFKLSHYACRQPECLQKNFIVFSTHGELELHNLQVHTNGGKSSKFMNQIVTGFHYDEQPNRQQVEEQMVIKDREGIDFKSQFLSQLQIDEVQTQQTFIQKNQKFIDIRNFYRGKYEKKDFTRVVDQCLQDLAVHLKGKYNQKQEKNSYTMKDLIFMKYCDIDMDKNSIYQPFFQILCAYPYVFEDYRNCLGAVMQGNMDPRSFFYQFLTLFGEKFTLKFFPFFIKTLNDKNQEALDHCYYMYCINIVRENNFVFNHQEYNAFFHKILSIIKEELGKQTQKTQIDFQKFQQYIQILKRLSFDNMVSLQNASLFGLNLETISLMKKQFYLSSDPQPMLEKLDQKTLFTLFCYYSLAYMFVKQPEFIENKTNVQNFWEVVTRGDMFEFKKKNQDSYQKHISPQFEASNWEISKKDQDLTKQKYQKDEFPGLKGAYKQEEKITEKKKVVEKEKEKLPVKKIENILQEENLTMIGKKDIEEAPKKNKKNQKSQVNDQKEPEPVKRKNKKYQPETNLLENGPNHFVTMMKDKNIEDEFPEMEKKEKVSFNEVKAPQKKKEQQPAQQGKSMWGGFQNIEQYQEKLNEEFQGQKRQRPKKNKKISIQEQGEDMDFEYNTKFQKNFIKNQIGSSMYQFLYRNSIMDSQAQQKELIEKIGDEKTVKKIQEQNNKNVQKDQDFIQKDGFYPDLPEEQPLEFTKIKGKPQGQKVTYNSGESRVYKNEFMLEKKQKQQQEQMNLKDKKKKNLVNFHFDMKSDEENPPLVQPKKNNFINDADFQCLPSESPLVFGNDDWGKNDEMKEVGTKKQGKNKKALFKGGFF